MRTSILILATLATLTIAQGTYPACAQACVSSALSSVSCLLANATCECAPAYSPAFSKAVTPCVEAACSTDDRYLAIEAYDYICDEWTLSLYTAGLTTFSDGYTTSSLVGGFLTTTAPARVTSTGSRAVTETSVAGIASASAGNGNGASSGTLLQSSSSSRGLSAGAKAGIGAGAAIGGLLFIGLIALAFIYGRRSAREKKKPEAPAPSPPAQVDQFGKVELGGDSKAGFVPGVVEVKVDNRHPLNSDEKAELENRRRAKDLESGVSRNSSVVVSPIATERNEVEAASTERFELEALRREAGVRYELG